MEQIFLAVNGDDVGKGIGNAIATDDHEELGRLSESINTSHSMIEEWVQNSGGQTVTSSGDEGIYQIPHEKLNEVEDIRAQYAEMSGNTLTIGVGASMSEASKALIYGKLNAKDQIIHYEPQIEDYLSDEGYEEDEETTESLQDEAALPDPEAIEGEAVEDEFAAQGGEVPEDFAGEDEAAEFDIDPEGEEEALIPEHEKGMSEEEEFAHDSAENAEDELDEDIVEADEEDPYVEGMPEEEGYADSAEAAAAEIAPEDMIEDESEEGMNGMTNAEEGEEEIIPEGESSDNAFNEEGETYEELGPEDIAGGTGPEAGMEGEMPPEEGGMPPGMEGEMPPEAGMEGIEGEGDDTQGMLSDMIHGQLNGEEEEGEEGNEDQLRDEIAEALIAFKQNKASLEEAQATNPQLYEATITMLRSMIEMAKKLGFSPEQQMEEKEAVQELEEEFPQDEAEEGEEYTEEAPPMVEESEDDEEAAYAEKKQ
jgi:hypothetical protein